MTDKKNIRVPAFIENVFSTEFGQKCLLSYITHPLAQKELPPKHGNIAICRELADVIREGKYDLDVVHYLYNGNLDLAKYKFIIGLGIPFEKSFYTGYVGKRLYFATGAYTGQRNVAELHRIRALKERTGIMAKPARLKEYPDFASSILCDAIICTGNEWTLDTYREVFPGPVYKVPVIARSYYSKNDMNRNWDTAKKSFLWFGAEGCILKGLDLCIEAFLTLGDLELHICGPASCEALSIYGQAIEQAKNIHYHGFVDVASERYKNILERCGLIVFPSASEGSAGTVLEAMAAGLIPIVTQETGIDVSEFGFLLDDAGISTLAKKIKEASNKDNPDLERRSTLGTQYTLANHSREVFRNGFKMALRSVLANGSRVWNEAGR